MRELGISKLLIKFVMEQAWVKWLRRFMLATKNAHPLYAVFSFASSKYPERIMEILQADIYQ